MIHTEKDVDEFAVNGLEKDAEAFMEWIGNGKGIDPVQVIGLASYHSMAISMKRIADALTGEGQNMLTMPLNAFGENIGNAIAGQIVRGMRGDDR